MKLYYDDIKSFAGRFRRKEIMDGSPCAILHDKKRLRAIVNELDKTGYFSQGSGALTKRGMKKALFGLHDAVEAIRGDLQLGDRRAVKHLNTLHTASLGMVAGFVLDGQAFAGYDRQEYLDRIPKETVAEIRNLADALSIELIQNGALIKLFNEGIQPEYRITDENVRSSLKTSDPHYAVADACLHLHRQTNDALERALLVGDALVTLTAVHELAMQTYPKLS